MGFGAKGKWHEGEKMSGGGWLACGDRSQVISPVIASEAIHLSAREMTMDCFAALAMTLKY